VHALRLLLRPFGYLAFVAAIAALSASAWLLGERHELGFFSGRLAKTVWRYPEVTRRGVQMAWCAWALLFALAISPYDPITSRWDEVALAGFAAIAFLRQRVYGRRAAD
jgi:hypothetical protein